MNKTSKRQLHIFLDESGDLGFNSKGSRYFIMAALVVEDPFPWEADLSQLRTELVKARPEIDLEYFHAAEDKQPVRDRVFSAIEPHLGRMGIHAIVVEKPKTGPALRADDKFYPFVIGQLLRYIFNGSAGREYDEIIVIADQCPIKKKRNAITGAVKNKLAEMLGGKVPYHLHFRDSKSTLSLQVVDYLGWAISRKWEKDDLRSYRYFQNQMKSEFEIFWMGRRYYYDHHGKKK